MRAIFVVAALAYPLLVMFGLARFQPRWVALAVAGVALARMLGLRGARRVVSSGALWSATVAVTGLILLAALLNDERYLRLLPTAINASLCVVFGATLFTRVSMVETFARLTVDELSSEELRYCRSVTAVWCGFFAFNGSVIAWLSVSASRETWALFTGLISYLLVGLLFALEFVYRHYRFRRYVGLPTDPWLKRWFPPREARGG
ncbi:MAG: hypothetical protein IT454_15670 [Planctomycetes bacterium]|nr:hypothetical protein [Planctomycetota bacterium]